MSAHPHILLLGATGTGGLIFIKHVQSLPVESRPRLTLYVRSRAKLTKGITTDDDIQTRVGALNDEKALSEAMVDGVTAVVSFLGPYLSFSHFLFRTTTPRPITEAMPAVFSAMRKNNIKRIMVLSTPSGYQMPGELPFSWYWWFFTVIMPQSLAPMADAEMRGIAEATAKQGDLDWTIFRVPHMNEVAENVNLQVGKIDRDYMGTTELSRPSLVKWVLNEVQERAWVHKAPMVSNP